MKRRISREQLRALSEIEARNGFGDLPLSITVPIRQLTRLYRRSGLIDAPDEGILAAIDEALEGFVVERQPIWNTVETGQYQPTEAARELMADIQAVLERSPVVAFESLPAPAHRPGPKPMADSDTIATARSALLEQGRPAGERSIARELGISRDAVRYAEGKDRR